MDNLNVERKPIPGYEGYYSVTSDGQVVSEARVINGLRHGTITKCSIKARVLKPSRGDGGYFGVALNKDGVQKTFRVHSLVAQAYLPPPLPGQTVVRHKEGDQSKNAKDDLEWGTQADNINDTIRHGTQAVGEKHGKAASTDEEIRRIKERLKAGEPQFLLAKELDLSKDKMHQIANDKSWAHIKV